MSITDITKKIIEDAENEAVCIVNGGKEEVEKILSSQKSIKSELEEKHIKDTDALARDNQKRVQSAAQREVKINIEKAKRNSIDKVYADALDKLINLSEKEYKDVLKSLLKDIPKEAKGSIYFPKKREEETKNVLRDMGFKNELLVNNDFSGGIIFLGDDFEYNLTFEHVLESKKEKIEIELASILFNNSEIK